MTTIAWDGQTLAGDTQITTGNIRGFVPTKLYRLPEGRLAGVAGSHDLAGQAIKWLLNKGEGDPPAWLEDQEAHASVLVIDKGTACYLGAGGELYPYGRRQWAIGSGGLIAMGAMAHGADARQAVAIAATLDESTGGTIQSMVPHA